MKNKKVIIIDLDGTLIDSSEGIFASARYALEKTKLPPMADVQLRAFIGPPLVQSFMKYCGLDEQDALEAVAIYREHYAEKGVKMYKPYDGIVDVLQSLKNSGKRLFVATGKPEHFARQIVNEAFPNCFEQVFGLIDEGLKSGKTEIIARVLGAIKPLDHSNCVMIGDTGYYIIGARANAMSSIGAAYGFPESRHSFNLADAVAKTPSDFVKILL